MIKEDQQTIEDIFAAGAAWQQTREEAYSDLWSIKDPVSGAVDPEIRQAAWEIINLEHYELHDSEWNHLTCDCVENPISAAEHDIIIEQGYKPFYEKD